MTDPAPTQIDGIAAGGVPDLSFLLDHTGHVLRTRMAAALAEIGMTARMHCVLVKALKEERTQAQIAELGDMDKTTMVVTVDALERAGLAERRPSANDRRARIIAVTKKGAAMAERSQAIVDGVHGDAIGSLPQETRAALVEALATLAEAHLASPVDSSAAVRRARQK
jgi:MarR family transcriptional regulator, transcriptional regulator for hemolysin